MKYPYKITSLICHLLVGLTILADGANPGVSTPRPGRLLEEGRAALSKGENDKALAMADSVLSISRNALTRVEALQLKIRAARNVADYNLCEQAYTEAENLFRNSPELAERENPATPDGENYSNLLLNHSQLEMALGRYDNASALLDSARCLPASPAEAMREGIRASLAYRRGDSGRALAILDTLLTRRLDSRLRATALQNRGYILNETGNYAEAARDLRESVGLLDGLTRAAALSNLALTYARLGRADEADEAIDEAIRLSDNSDSFSDKDRLTALRKKGEVLFLTGRPRQSAEILRKYLPLERDRLYSTLSRMSPGMRLDYWTMERPNLSRPLMLEDTDPELMLDIALLRRELSIPELGKSEDKWGLQPTTAELRKALRPGEAAVAFVRYPDKDNNIRYGAIALPYNSEPKFILLEDESFADTPRLEGGASINRAIESEDPRLKNLLYTDKSIGDEIWEPILTSLPADIHTIHFAPEGIFHLWNIEEMPFGGSDGMKLIRHFSLLDLKERKERSRKISGEKALVAGGLDYDAEPESTAGIETTDHQAYEELTRSIGNPDGESIFGYLAGTLDEARSVAGAVEGSIFTTSLSEEDFKAGAPGWTLLHLATHGYALDCGLGGARSLPGDSLAIDISLLRSGLALTGANVLGEEPLREDGILSAREVCLLPLDDADIVVLSACQTAKGLITDENASGLIRAFKIAGASTVVASLWEVDDKATSLFMKEFHRLLATGMPKHDAFRAAKSYLRDLTVKIPVRRFSPASLSSRPITTTEHKPYADPWYWAPFIIIDP